MLYHERINVFEGNDVNKTSAKSVLFFIKGIFCIKGLSFNLMTVMGVMMF